MKITAIAAALLLVPGLAFAAGEEQQTGSAEQGQMQHEQMEQGQMGQEAQQEQEQQQQEFGQEQQRPAQQQQQQAVEGQQRQQQISQQSGKVRGNVVSIDLTQGTMRLSHAEVALGQTELPEKSLLERRQEAREGEQPSSEQMTQRQQIQQRKDVTVYGTPGQLSKQELGKQATLEFVQYGNQAWLTEGAGGELPEDFGEAQQAQGAIRNINTGTGSFSLGQAGQFYVHPRELQNLRPGQFVSITYQQVGNNNWVEQVQQQQQEQQLQEQQQPQEGIEGQQQDTDIDVDVEREQQGMEGQEGIEGQPEPEQETEEGGGLFE